MDDLLILSLLRSLLIVWLAFPRLAPWAVFLRRFAASRVELRSTDSQGRLSPHNSCSPALDFGW